MQHENFQTTISGKKTDLYFIGSKNIQVALCNYGARIVSIKVPDKNNVPSEVLFTFDSLEAFQKADNPYYGATIGRYANRIARGKFSLHGRDFDLQVNNGMNHLHGGEGGFHNVVWDVRDVSATAVTFFCHSPDGDGGYPGSLDVTVTFTAEPSLLKINYSAVADRNTVINLTNHAFFNLNGKNSGDILNHGLQINAEYYTPVDETLIPTGRIDSVEHTPFDFRTPKKIGQDILQNYDQLKAGLGYDHNYVLMKNKRIVHAATVTGDKSGISMNIFTSEPGLQFYSGNFMQNDFYRNALALETQHFPDSPNHPRFPSTELKEKEIYSSETIYQFEAG